MLDFIRKNGRIFEHRDLRYLRASFNTKYYGKSFRRVQCADMVQYLRMRARTGAMGTILRQSALATITVRSTREPVLYFLFIPIYFLFFPIFFFLRIRAINNKILYLVVRFQHL